MLEGKAAYFTVYGNTTGSRWRHFLEHFCSIATELGEEKVIEGAVCTFRLLDEWMQDKQTVPAI
jgi:heme oxygenase